MAAWVLLAGACGQDPVLRLQRQHPHFAPERTLGEVLDAYSCFSRVSWSSTAGPGATPTGRATGIFAIECLVGAQSNGRIFTRQECDALAKAGANLCCVLEYAFPPDKPDGELTGMAVMIVTSDWTQAAPLADDQLLREIAENRLGERTIKAALDAADYARLRR